MQILQKVIVSLFIAACLANFSLALGETYAVDNPGWRYVEYNFNFTLPGKLFPSDAINKQDRN